MNSVRNLIQNHSYHVYRFYHGYPVYLYRHHGGRRANPHPDLDLHLVDPDPDDLFDLDHPDGLDPDHLVDPGRLYQVSLSISTSDRLYHGCALWVRRLSIYRVILTCHHPFDLVYPDLDLLQ